MELNKIKELLAKYYQGETTLEEEKALKNFLNKDIVPDEFKPEQATFQYFEEVKKITFSKTLEYQKSPDTNTPAIKKIWWSSLAACLILGLLIVYWFPSFNNTDTTSSISVQQNPGTYEDPEKAYFEAKKALLLVSRKMNKGTDQMQKFSKFHTAQVSIAKQKQ